MGKLCDRVLNIGDMAVSLKGHDTGRLYVVVAEIGEFVLVADGEIRSIGNPKQKRRKHLCFVKETNCKIDDASIKRQIKLTEEQNAKRR